MSKRSKKVVRDMVLFFAVFVVEGLLSRWLKFGEQISIARSGSIAFTATLSADPEIAKVIGKEFLAIFIVAAASFSYSCSFHWCP